MLHIIFERSITSESQVVVCKVRTGKYVEPDFISFYLVSSLPIQSTSGVQYADCGVNYLQGNNGFLIRIYGAINSLGNNRCHVKLFGNYNYDNIEILDSFGNRVEIRNENGVLLADNGRPWLNGKYPPDAKNRADLAGLHASPAVINPELETALMGDETNKERVQE